MNDSNEDFSSPALRLLRQAKRHARILRRGGESDETIRAEVMGVSLDSCRGETEAARRSVLELTERAIEAVLAEPRGLPDPAGTYPTTQFDLEAN